MNKFEENNPEQLEKFIKELVELYDKYHPNIYLMDEIFDSIENIKTIIQKQIRDSRLDY